MKKIISNNELKEKMKEAINLLCNTVKTTLGPKGSNIIIDHSSFTPFITNDGVTIAQNIESEDEVINTVLELAKESSIKTNETVGDGTTTTLALLQGIFNNGQKLIEEGKNPIILKKELNATLPKLLDFINSKSTKPKKEDLYHIACISANSNEIGKNISDAYQKVKSTKAINIKEGNETETKMLFKKGYSIETLIASTLFFKDQTEINIKNSYILLLNNYLNDIEDISEILNEIIEKNKSLLIIAEDYSDIFINQVLSLFLNENINIYLLKTPEYGKNKIDTLNDLALITKSKIIEDLNYININTLGQAPEIIITKEQTTLKVEESEKIKNKIKELQKLLNSSLEIDKDFINRRISMLKKGLIEIVVGAATETERREKKMRYDDALCAIDASVSGIVAGSGIVFYELSDSLTENTDVEKILSQALKVPFNQITFNAGLNSEEIIQEIKNNHYKKIFNITKNVYEKTENTTVIDPTKVLISSLTNAISIAGMLLTTTSLIINEYQNNLNKVNDYNEL